MRNESIKTIILFALILISCKKEEIKVPENDKGYTVKYGKNVNYGHRLGSEVIKGLRQNTLEVLNAALDEKIYEKSKFKYWEFDVRETKDKILIVHHDRSLIKKKKIYIDKLTYNEVIEIKPDVPLYGAVLSTLNERFKGEVAVEIKSVISDSGRSRLIEEVDKYNAIGNLKIKYLAFPKKFKKSFPKNNRKFWCEKMKFVMRARVHRINLCK